MTARDVVLILSGASAVLCVQVLLRFPSNLLVTEERIDEAWEEKR